jgi:hypothetical protein
MRLTAAGAAQARCRARSLWRSRSPTWTGARTNCASRCTMTRPGSATRRWYACSLRSPPPAGWTSQPLTRLLRAGQGGLAVPRPRGALHVAHERGRARSRRHGLVQDAGGAEAHHALPLRGEMRPSSARTHPCTSLHALHLASNTCVRRMPLPSGPRSPACRPYRRSRGVLAAPVGLLARGVPSAPAGTQLQHHVHGRLWPPPRRSGRHQRARGTRGALGLCCRLRLISRERRRCWCSWAS